MKVKATKDVHIRQGKAERGETNLKGVLNKGFSLEVVETKNDGEDIDGNRIWYKDKNGDWYWSGGFVNNSNSGETNSISKRTNYNELLQIPEEFQKTKGSGIDICVIDSGVFHTHPDLRLGKSNSLDCSDSEFGSVDTIGHGTHICGLIGANTKQINGITGVSPGSKIISIKARNEVEKFEQSFVAKAINKAIELNVNIINMSFKLSFVDNSELIKAIDDAHTAGIIMVAAAGNNDTLTFDRFNRPAFLDGIVAVGAVDSNVNGRLNYNSKIDFVLPKKRFLSTSISSKNNYEELEGSSMATAIVTGALALIASKRGIKSSINTLKEISDSILDFESENHLKIYTL